MAVGLYAVDATWSTLNAFSVTNPNMVLIDDETKKFVTTGTLNSLTIYANKATNPNTTVSGSGATYGPGKIKSENDVSMYFNINGNNTGTQKLDNNAIVNFSSSGYNAYAKANKSYTFTNLNVALSANTKINLRFTGLVSSVPATVATIWRQSPTKIGDVKYRRVGSAVVSTGPENPSKITLDSTNITITDLSGVEPNNNNNVLKGPSASVKVTADKGEITNLTITSNPSNIATSYKINTSNKKEATISLKANNTNTNYPTKTTTKITSNGNVSATLTVNFYEKIDHIISLKTTNIVANILQLTKPLYYELTSSYSEYKTTEARGKRLFNKTTNQNESFSIYNSTMLKPENYFSLAADNIYFPIKQQNTPHSLVWRFYNTSVQNANSEQGTYKRDLNTTLTYTMTPSLQDQFSYQWQNKDGSVVSESDVPTIILYNQDAPSIKQLKYTNQSGYGGYCRGFKIDLIDDSTDSVVKTIKYNQDADKNTSETILNKDIFSDFAKEKTGFYKIKITTYFYFTNSSSTLYEGVSKTLNQRLLLISDKELLPSLIFPKLNKTEPYTHMMLTSTERYGYEFNDIVFNYQEQLRAVFGLKIEYKSNSETKDKTITIQENPTYFSSDTITKHLVFNISKFVKDNSDLSTVDVISIKPFLRISLGGEKTKDIFLDENPSDKEINAVTDITKAKFWLRPEVKSGESIEYFDYTNCENFIDKYIYLSDSKEEENFKLKLGTALAQTSILLKYSDFTKTLQGEITNTDFWNVVAVVLSEYADNLQNWATDATDYSDLWALPQFKHKKGEQITNNNLYQNYWDLLDQYNTNFTIHGEEEGSDFPAVRLKNESGAPIKYTHNELNSGNYTHNEITNQFRKRGI